MSLKLIRGPENSFDPNIRVIKLERAPKDLGSSPVKLRGKGAAEGR